LFEHFEIERMVFDFRKTPRNAPFEELLRHLLDGADVEGEIVLDRNRFERLRPPLYRKQEVLG
jgi:hypothetical protein